MARGDYLRERFEAKVDRSAGPDGCHIWTAARSPNGYGSMGAVVVDGALRSQIGAHRVAFYLVHGHWPEMVRHTCDNPPCVNPLHLLAGDARSNAADMIARGRAPYVDRTHCPQGHEYSTENTWRDKRGWRKCRRCRYEAVRRCRAKKRVATT